MEKIKVAMIGAAGKMGTRMARSLLTMPDRYEVKLVEGYAPAIPRVEQELGMKCVPAQEAIDFADIVVFAVKDSMIKELSKQYVPMLKPGTVFMILDPAAAIAKEVTLRDDCTFVVTHPCHPSFLKWQKEEEAYNDRFGGDGGHQDVVMSKICGTDEKMEMVKEATRCMYRADDVFLLTTEQIAFLEPTLVEVMGACFLYAMAETVDEGVKRGIPREAAVSFMTGHVLNLSANFLGYLPGNPPVSDACKVAIQLGNRLVLRDDWRRVWDDDVLKKVIATMLHPENPQI